MQEERKTVLDTEAVITTCYLIIENASANKYYLNKDYTCQIYDSASVVIQKNSLFIRLLGYWLSYLSGFS
jgi:hypothetical protein